MKKILIGGRALVALGSSRNTLDIKFLMQNHGVRTLSVVKKYVSQSEFEEIQKLNHDVKV